MATYPLDENKAYETLHDGIASYAGALSPQQQHWLKSAINEAAQFPTPAVSADDRLFSDPIKVAQILIEEKRSFEIVIASLIYSRIKKEQLSDDAYQKKLRDIAVTYGDKVQLYARYALQFAHTDLPNDDQLQEKYRISEVERQKYFADIRERKKLVPTLKAKPKQTEEEKQTTLFVNYLDDLNEEPESQAIRLADRWVLLQEFDPDNLTNPQKKRIKESWLVHAQLANNHGLRRFYYDFGNLYVRAFFPHSYRAITALNDYLAKMENAENDVLGGVTEYMSRKLTEAGLVQKDNLDDIKGGYYIKKRYQKSPISIITKLIGDGIDPEDYFKRHADETAKDQSMLMRLVVQVLFVDGRLKDALACTIIADEEALVELGHIKRGEANKPWHTHKNACEWMGKVLDEGTQENGELRRDNYTADPERDKNYFTDPRGRREYRSLHKGKSKLVSLPGLDDKNKFPLSMEIILRTKTVNFEAEYGRWAHASFKSETIRREAAWRAAQANVTSRRKVYLFTQKNKMLEFNAGTRIRDVAFEINQDLGLYCTGATAYRGYKGWRDDLTVPLQPLKIVLTPDTLIDDIAGCTIIIHADVPQAVKEMRAQQVIGYPEMPPGYTDEKLQGLIGDVTTDLSKRKINTIRKRLELSIVNRPAL